MRLFCAIAAIWFVSRTGHARQDGSIPSSAACDNMTPQHGTHRPQSSNSPYYIETESLFFIESMSLPVYLDTNTSTTPFKGFYCQARDADNVKKIEGHFETLTNDTKGHSCFLEATDKFNAISHSGTWSSNPKTSLELNWTPPESDEVIVRVRCTFVQSFSTFWVAVQSDVIKPLSKVSVDECCSDDEIDDACWPLCRRINQKPDELELLANVLKKASRNDDDCSFKKALRCSYWSSTAENFNVSLLHECCNRLNMSDDCWPFCTKDIYGTMGYTADELNTCLTETPELSSCIVFPGYGEASGTFNTTQSTLKASKTTSTNTSFAVTSVFTERQTTQSAITSSSTTTTDAQLSVATKVLTQNVFSSFAATTASTKKTTQAVVTTAAKPVATTTMPTKSVSSSVASTTSTRKTTQAVVTSAAEPFATTKMPTQSVSSSVASTKSSSNSKTLQVLVTTAAVIASSTKTSATTGSSGTVGTENGSTTTVTTISASPATTPDFAQAPETVIFDITTTVDVTGATQNNSLRMSIFDALEINLLRPALDPLAGYDRVNVGTEYYEGSLVVVSEGVFLQRSDGTITLLTEVKNALDNRLTALNYNIGIANDKWTINDPAQVERKEINGECQSTDCGASKSCVEVGSNNTVCVCLNNNNVEISCANSESGLSAGAVAGIVIGCIALVVIIIVLVLCTRRRSPRKRESSKPSQINMTRSFSANSNEGYVDPNSPGMREEPLYTYISSNLSSSPPPLPPDNKVQALPSHSTTYDQADSDKIMGFRENEEGYMEAVLTEECTKPEKDDAKASPGNEYAEAYTLYKKEDNKESPKTVKETAEKETADSKVDGYDLASEPSVDAGYSSQDKSAGHDAKQTPVSVEVSS